MPYITQDRRDVVDAGFPPETVGELNYALCSLILTSPYQRLGRKFLEQMLEWWNKHEHRYATINDILGAATGAKQEIYRRMGMSAGISMVVTTAINAFYDQVAAPYEDAKIKENGDLPWSDE